MVPLCQNFAFAVPLTAVCNVSLSNPGWHLDLYVLLDIAVITQLPIHTFEEVARNYCLVISLPRRIDKSNFHLLTEGY